MYMDVHGFGSGSGYDSYDSEFGYGDVEFEDDAGCEHNFKPLFDTVFSTWPCTDPFFF